MADGPNRPNRPIRPRGGGPGGRRRRVVIEGGAARGRDARAARDRPAQAPARPQALVQPTGPVTVESGVTVTDLSAALGVPMSQIIKILMGLGQMRTATQSLSDDEVELIAAEVEREVTIKHAADDEEPEIVEDAGGPHGPAARCDDHGSRRPRQDDAARRDPLHRRRRDRGRRDHAAHRRVPDRGRRPQAHVPRHAGPRGVHGDARPRCEGDGHRRPRRRRGRWRDAADEGVDQPRPGRRGAHRRGDQQDRRPRREPRPGQDRARRRGPAAGGLGRHHPVRPGLSQAADETSASCWRRSCWSRTRSSTCARTRRPRPPARSSSRGSTSAAAPSRPCSSSAARCTSATRSWRATPRATSARSTTIAARRCGRPSRASLSRSSASTVRPRGRARTRRRARAPGEGHRRERAERLRREQLAQRSKTAGVALETLFERMQEGAVQDLNVVLKGDVQGSVEALMGELGKIQHPEVRVNVIHTGVGGINENDIYLASASNAPAVGFNVRPSAEARQLAEREGVDIRMYRVIYKLTEDIEQALVGMLAGHHRGSARGGRGAPSAFPARHDRGVHGHERARPPWRARPHRPGRHRDPRDGDRPASASRTTRAR